MMHHSFDLTFLFGAQSVLNFSVRGKSRIRQQIHVFTQLAKRRMECVYTLMGSEFWYFITHFCNWNLKECIRCGNILFFIESCVFLFLWAQNCCFFFPFWLLNALMQSALFSLFDCSFCYSQLSSWDLIQTDDYFVREKERSRTSG